jgi:hypothetical protein
MNKMTPVWCQSVKRLESYRTFLCFSLLPFYGWENEGWQDSHATSILQNSVLSKITPVWSRYLKRFKSYSIFKCWSSKIQDGVPRPKWRNLFHVAWQIDFYCHEVYLCQKGCLYSVCTFVTIHFVTSLHTDIHTSVDSITQIHS